MLKYNDKSIYSIYYKDNAIQKIYYSDKLVWQRYTIFLTKSNNSVDKLNKKSIESQEFREIYYKNVLITGAVKTIGDYSFYKCSIYELELQEGIEVIERFAFHSNNLKVVRIPKSVKEIGEGTFYSNPINTVYISRDTKYWHNSFPKTAKIIYY